MINGVVMGLVQSHQTRAVQPAYVPYVSMSLDVVADLVKFIVKQDSPLVLRQPTLQ